MKGIMANGVERVRERERVRDIKRKRQKDIDRKR